MTQLTNGQHACELVFLQMVDILHIPLTVNMFSLYLMKFMFDTTLDAVVNILTLHYDSRNVMFHFHNAAYVRHLGEVNMLFVYV